MPNTRHHIFQQIASALAHQENGNIELALAYWEHALSLLPEEVLIQNAILEACEQLVARAGLPTDQRERDAQKLAKLSQAYRHSLDKQQQTIYQRLFQAICQQSVGNFSLAFMYWQTLRQHFASDTIIVTIVVQDVCWNADQFLHTHQVAKCIELYEQLLQLFPDFFEGYINLSIVKFKHNYVNEALLLLKNIPRRYQNEFIVTCYRELFHRLAEIRQQFDHVPYASIEDLVADITIENTYYPAIIADYFAEFINDLVKRERRFFEKRRKTLEQKAIIRTNKRLSLEGTPLGQRVTLAKQARSEEIPQYLNDNEIRIAEVLLDNPNITSDDVLVMAQTTHVSEILRCIAEHRKWRSLHAITMAVVLNPQTLPQDAIPLLKLLNINDLATVFYKKNIPTDTRIRAKSTIHARFNALSHYERMAVIEATTGRILKLLDTIEVDDITSFVKQLLENFETEIDILVNICQWKLTPSTMLASLGNTRRFSTNLRLKFSLLTNPRTPTSTLVYLLHKTSPKNLRFLIANRHLPAAVKEIIAQLFPDIVDGSAETEN